MYLTLILQRMIRTSNTRVQTVMIPHSINNSQIILNGPYLTLVWPEECNPILMTIRIERSFKMRVRRWVYFLGKSKMSPCVSLWQYIKVVWQMIFRLSFVCNLCLHINEKEFDFRSLTVRILESGISFWRSTNIKVKSTTKIMITWKKIMITWKFRILDSRIRKLGGPKSGSKDSWNETLRN